MPNGRRNSYKKGSSRCSVPEYSRRRRRCRRRRRSSSPYNLKIFLL